MMILVFKKFRKLGIGRKLMEFLEEEVKKNKKEENIEYIALLVKETNTTAIKFYEKMDFKVVEKKENYYKNLENPDALLMKKMI